MTRETTLKGLRYDSATETYHFFHEGPDRVSTAVVLAIAEIEGTDPLEMDPLYEAVPTDLIDRLAETDDDVTGDVMFTYHGYRVTVDSHGGVVVRAIEA